MTADESTTQLLVSKGYVAIPIRQNVAGQLLISATVNDVEGVYILDSGAGRTVIDSARVDALGLKLKHDEAESTGGGIGGHGVENVPSYHNAISIGGFRMDNLAVAVMPLSTAWESLAQVGAYEELYGIIGVDVLKAGSALVDFSTMTLYLRQPEGTTP